MSDHYEENIQGRERHRFSAGNFRSTSSPGRSKEKHPPKAKGPSEEARSCVDNLIRENSTLVEYMSELMDHFDNAVRNLGNRYITANVKAARDSTASKARQLLIA